MKKLLITLFSLVISSALADTHIPNTQVSYKISKDDIGQNNSMVFVDDIHDKSGKTYASFNCESGTPNFQIYSKQRLGRSFGENVGVAVSADNNVPKRGSLYLRKNIETGQLSVLVGNVTTGAQAASIFLSAQNQVAIRVERTNASPVTYIFPVKGFTQAYRAIKACD